MLRLEVETFCGCATSKTGAHICGWFNFFFNAIFIALQVHILAGVKNIADAVRKSLPGGDQWHPELVTDHMAAKILNLTNGVNFADTPIDNFDGHFRPDLKKLSQIENEMLWIFKH